MYPLRAEAQLMQLKLAEFADLCLAELYNLAKAEGIDQPQPIRKVFHKLNVADLVTMEKVAQFLQSKGCLGIATTNMAGPRDIQITPFGMTTAEAGGLTGLIPSYRQEPWKFTKAQLS